MFFSFSFDCFSNASNLTHSSHEVSIESGTSQKTTVSRSYSDSSTISTKSNEAAAKANLSVDNIPTKQQQQLLKLSFFNSPNSPMNSTLFQNTSLADSVYSEARKIAKKFADSGDMSFEDLNNVSQPDSSDVSIIDSDLQDMKVNVLSKNPQPAATPSADKIALFQERLNCIKKEVDPDAPIFIKEEKYSPRDRKKDLDGGDCGANAKELELDEMLKKLKSLMIDGNKDEAKKHLQLINDLMGKQPGNSEPKNTMHVQPIVRQDTFDIDPETGKRKYIASTLSDEKTEIMERLAMLLGAQSLDVHSIDVLNGASAGTKLVVVVPNTSSTPVKLPPRLAMSTAKKTTQSAMKAADLKKHTTPMKPPAHVQRLSSFTTPRPVPSLKPLEQKNVQSRAVGVRKSLMNSMEKSPQVQRKNVQQTSATPGKTAPPKATARRSVSMKATIPTVNVRKASPQKTIRPATGAPYATGNRRLSQMPAPLGRPSTNVTPRASLSSRIPDQKKSNPVFKTPACVTRKTAAHEDKGSLV